MAISRELILEAADIRRVSIRCSSCGAEAAFTLQPQARSGIPLGCPSCSKRWNDAYAQLQAFGEILDDFEKFGIRFRVAEPGSIR
jgi:hypothetical protein